MTAARAGSFWASAFAHGVEASRTIGDFAVCQLLQYALHLCQQGIASKLPTGNQHPRGEHVLIGAGETDLAGKLLVSVRGYARGRTNQILSQHRRPKLPAYHCGRLAANVVEIQRGLDVMGIGFRVPTKTVEFGDRLFVISFMITKRCDDRDGLCPTAFLNDPITNLAKDQMLIDRFVSHLVHPLRLRRTRPNDEVIILAKPATSAKVTWS